MPWTATHRPHAQHRPQQSPCPRLPIEILKRYEKLKDFVRVSGPRGLSLIQEFRDEALRGEWRALDHPEVECDPGLCKYIVTEPR